MTDGYLKKVYGLTGAEAVRRYYDNWAATYDAELHENGYATPSRAAKALAGVQAAKGAPLLDMGCGTGLSGLALAAEGFEILDGCDPSEEMRRQAQARGLYRRLYPSDAAITDHYASVAAVGVIGAGAAPASLLESCLELLSPGGFLVFSFNDHALEIPDYPAKLEAVQKSGTATLIFEEHGPHLPKMNISSTVYVLEKQ